MISTRRSIHRTYYQLALEGPVSIRKLATAIPVSPATIYHHATGAEALVERAERRAIAQLRLACRGLAPGQERIGAVAEALCVLPGLAELVMDYDRAHETWPTSFCSSLLPQASTPAAARQAISDLLGGLAHAKRADPDLRLCIDTDQAWRSACLMLDVVECVEEVESAEVVVEETLDDVLSSTKAAMNEPNPKWKSLIESAIDASVGEGDFGARRIQSASGVSNDSLYSMGGPRALTKRIDETLHRVYLTDRPTWDFYTHISRRILAFAPHHPTLFQYLAKKRDPGPGLFDDMATGAFADARRRQWLRASDLDDRFLASLTIGPVVRRFRNREREPRPWDDIRAFSAATEQILIDRTATEDEQIRS